MSTDGVDIMAGQSNGWPAVAVTAGSKSASINRSRSSRLSYPHVVLRGGRPPPAGVLPHIGVGPEAPDGLPLHNILSSCASQGRHDVLALAFAFAGRVPELNLASRRPGQDPSVLPRDTKPRSVTSVTRNPESDRLRRNLHLRHVVV